MMHEKTCTKCSKTFPATLEFFYKNSGGKYGVTPRCKTCVNQENMASHLRRKETNPEKIKAQASARSQRHYHRNLERSREKQRNYQAKKRADPKIKAMINMAKRAGGARLKPEDFEKMFEAQGRKCAICGTAEPGAKHGWNIDHCHISGKVRFILCAHCNRGLGAFFDDPTLMRRAADKLEQYQNQADRPVSAVLE